MFRVLFIVFGLTIISSRANCSISFKFIKGIHKWKYIDGNLYISVPPNYHPAGLRLMCDRFTGLNRKHLITNGGWSPWSPVTKEYNGIKARRRECNSPFPRYSGRYCIGGAIQIYESGMMNGPRGRSACVVPYVGGARTLNQAVHDVREVINFIKEKLDPMSQKIEMLVNELKKKETGIASTFGVLTDYTNAGIRLNATLRGIKNKVISAWCCGYYEIEKEMIYDEKSVEQDQKKFQEFIQNVDYELKKTESEKAKLIKKKTEATQLGSKLKNLILNYKLYADSGNEDLDLADEERDEINQELDDGTAKLRAIFC